MVITKREDIQRLLASPAAVAEALSIVKDTRNKHGDNARFGLMRISTSPNSKSWVMVS